MTRQYSSNTKLNRHNPGDAVWHAIPKHQIGKNSKLDKKWVGPYLVCRKISDVVYKIKTGPKSKPKAVHHNSLRPYEGEYKPKWSIN